MLQSSSQTLHLLNVGVTHTHTHSHTNNLSLILSLSLALSVSLSLCQCAVGLPVQTHRCAHTYSNPVNCVDIKGRLWEVTLNDRGKKTEGNLCTHTSGCRR